MSKRVVIIVQARMASTRLPGKVLERLAGETVLAQVLRRCSAIEGADELCCAVPQGADCDAVAEEAERCGATVFRGSESDVLERYHQAAVACRADVVMRITSDCPLIDPDICGRLLRLFKGQGLDYACNNAPRGWPLGLDCEVFTAGALARAAAEATSPAEREHVTPWLRRHPGIRRASLDGPGGDLAALRWTLDTADDLAFLRAFFALLPPAAGFEEALALYRANPEIHQPAGSPQLDAWRGDFGDAYLGRNDADGVGRTAMWERILQPLADDPPRSILEVGANIGLNLRALAGLTGARLIALEPHAGARARLIDDGVVSPGDAHDGCAAAIPLADGAVDMAFTSGVLIHIAPPDLEASCAEIHRVARRYIACAEYFSDAPEAVPYRGRDGLLFKRDFGDFWMDRFADLRLMDYGFFWRRATGLDNLTWWLFEKGSV